jgi:putative multiple sugar transport system permease protein
VLALIAIMAFFQVMTDGTLLRPVNITNLFLQNSYIIIMALGMLLVIVAGHIDLSVGSVVGFVGALAAVMMVNWDHVGLPDHSGLPPGRHPDRGGAGVLDRLLAHSLLHRDPCRDAGVSRRIAVVARRPVGRTVPAEFQALSTGFIPDLLPFVKTLAFRGRAHERFGVVTGMVIAGMIVWLGLRARAPAIAPTASLRRADEFLHRCATCWSRAPSSSCPTSCHLPRPAECADHHGHPDHYLRLHDGIDGSGRRIYALGGNEKAAKLSGIRPSG